MLRTGRITQNSFVIPSHTLGVLVVDPDANHLALWGSLLSYAGYRVFCARSAFEAMLYLSSDVQCVVLSDQLPDFDCLDYVDRLAVPGVREFVLLAEQITPCAAEQAMSAGAGAVLAKTTVSLQGLVDAIEGACRPIPHAPPVHVEPSLGQSSDQSVDWLARSA